jgi:hypothetical protein
MGKIYVEGKTFDREDFSERTLEPGDYENCVFHQVLLTGYFRAFG